MFYRVFTLHPEIFSSFLSHSLIARGLANGIISAELCNWRSEFGIGSYKQVDDRPYGGGNGMVLMPEPIFNALKSFDSITKSFSSNNSGMHRRVLPNNSTFFHNNSMTTDKPRKATIMLTPKGFPLNQNVVSWLSEFNELNILCGRYEGFDSRVSEIVDLEISVGDYILNGGEVAAMSLIESISRLVPGFITKTESVKHDSFSEELNHYSEMSEYVIGKRNISKKQFANKSKNMDKVPLFDDDLWIKNILPKLEHPQYTRPAIWRGFEVPSVILNGNHKDIQYWRANWYSI